MTAAIVIYPSPKNKNVSAFRPEPGEKRLFDEDCSEDTLKSGILVLTNHRIIFQETTGRMATFSKEEGEVVLQIPLDRISAVRSEGFLVKKLVIESEGKAYKFGVFSIGKWEKEIKAQMAARKS